MKLPQARHRPRRSLRHELATRRVGRRRHRRSRRRRDRPAVLDALRHVARRGAHRQHLAAAAVAASRRVGARRCTAALLRPAPFLDEGLRIVRSGRPVALRGIERRNPSFRLDRGQALGGRGVGIAVAVLVSTSPFAIYYGTEARMYSLVACLTTVGVCGSRLSAHGGRPSGIWSAPLFARGCFSTRTTGRCISSWSWALGSHSSRGGARNTGGAARAWHSSQRGGRLSHLRPLGTHVRVPVAAHRDSLGGARELRRDGECRQLLRRRTDQPGPCSRPALLRPRRARAVRDGERPLPRHCSIRGRRRRDGASGSSIVGTLGLAVAGGYLQGSAFSSRYASVIFVPLLLLVAMGLATMVDRRIASACTGRGRSVRTRYEQSPTSGRNAARPSRCGRFSPGQGSPATSSPTAPTSWGPTPPAPALRQGTSRSPSLVARPAVRGLGRLRQGHGFCLSPGIRRAARADERARSHDLVRLGSRLSDLRRGQCEAVENTLLADHQLGAARSSRTRPARSTSPWSWWRSVTERAEPGRSAAARRVARAGVGGRAWSCLAMPGGACPPVESPHKATNRA